MTTSQALTELLRYQRDIIVPELADDIAGAWGFTLKDLKVAVRPLTDQGIMHNPKYADVPSVDVSTLASKLCEKVTGVKVTSDMLGHGSHASDITIKAVKALKAASKVN